MQNHFNKLTNTLALEDLVARSYCEPVLIFKHSDACGISSRAYSEMATLDRPIALVTVQTERAVSTEIERRFGVAHETPQVLILRDGKVVWSASHGQVKAEAVEAAVLSVPPALAYG
ncbi:MAG TPA: bacillithiol system redox-active protein YtxJ [Pyrinomonadaceae bacterium]|nr:bacillithiol system redox-active protein YtxJ [Pyrinomonadaceae bacterium]